MGTRATIRFKDEYEEYYVYAGHDGYPENVLNNIEHIIDKKEKSWSGSECGTLVSCFLGQAHEENKRLPFYEMTTGFHGDESYKYFVNWDVEAKQWVCTVEH